MLLDLNIYGSTVRLSTQDASLLKVFQDEFHFFIHQVKEPDFYLTLHHTAAPAGLLPVLRATKISQNSISYDDGDRRWNDYFGKALSVVDYKTGEAVLYCEDKDFLHELAYLLVLSLTGKDLDLRGWHKIHACGFRYRGRDVVIMLPSKGGKSTLFTLICERPGVELVSDDTPLCNHQGHIYPFPLRMGLDELPPKLQGQDWHRFKRQHYSDKWLIPLHALGAPISQGSAMSTIVFVGERTSNHSPSIVPASFTQSMKALVQHMVIGIGLPMILEYFIQNRLADWIRLFKIGRLRLWAALKLWQNGSFHIFSMGQDPRMNVAKLFKKLDEM